MNMKLINSSQVISSGRHNVRRHIDQMIRTPHLKVRIERIETGVLVKSHRGKNVSAARRMVNRHLCKAKCTVLTVENKMDTGQEEILQFSEKVSVEKQRNHRLHQEENV